MEALLLVLKFDFIDFDDFADRADFADFDVTFFRVLLGVRKPSCSSPKPLLPVEQGVDGMDID